MYFLKENTFNVKFKFNVEFKCASGGINTIFQQTLNPSHYEPEHYLPFHFYLKFLAAGVGLVHFVQRLAQCHEQKLLNSNSS